MIKIQIKVKEKKSKSLKSLIYQALLKKHKKTKKSEKKSKSIKNLRKFLFKIIQKIDKNI